MPQVCTSYIHNTAQVAIRFQNNELSKYNDSHKCDIYNKSQTCQAHEMKMIHERCMYYIEINIASMYKSTKKRTNLDKNKFYQTDTPQNVNPQNSSTGNTLKGKKNTPGNQRKMYLNENIQVLLNANCN